MGCCLSTPTPLSTPYEQVTSANKTNGTIKGYNNINLDNNLSTNGINGHKNGHSIPSISVITRYKKKDLQKHHTLSTRTTYTISVQMIRKIFCNYIRGSNLQNLYFINQNITFSNKTIDIITNYCEDFF